MEESGKTQRSRGRCFTCGERGHHYRDCWVPMVTDKVCFWCGKRGHVQRKCRLNKALKIVPKGDPHEQQSNEVTNVRELIENAKLIVVSRSPSPPSSPATTTHSELGHETIDKIDEDRSSSKSSQLQSIDLENHLQSHGISNCRSSESSSSSSSVSTEPSSSSSSSITAADDNNQYEIVSSVSTESFENINSITNM